MLPTGNTQVTMDFDKLVKGLEEKGLLEDLKERRLATSRMPATLYLKIVIASLALNKPKANILMTALHTYVNRNYENHLKECKVQAKIEGMALEEWLCEAIAKQLE